MSPSKMSRQDKMALATWKAQVLQGIDPGDLLEAIGSRGVQQQGETWRGTCPIHRGDGVGNFAWDVERDLWTCYSRHCHTRWVRDILGLVEGATGQSFGAALQWLATWSGVPWQGAMDAEAQAQWLALRDAQANRRWSETVQAVREPVPVPPLPGVPLDWTHPIGEYVLRRGIDPAVAEVLGWRMGSADPRADTLILPVWDFDGTYVGHQVRTITDRPPRYRTHFPKGAYWYHGHRAQAAARELGMVVIVEGVFDVARLVQWGFDAVVAPLGSHVTPLQIQRLATYCPTDWYIMLDGDAAGQDGATAFAQSASRWARVFQIPLPPGTDPDTLTLAAFYAALGSAQRILISV